MARQEKEPMIEFIVGDTRVIVDFEKMTKGMRDSLEDRVIEVRQKTSLYFKYPYEEGETEEQWSERVSALVKEEYARQEGESVKEHLNRMFNAKDSQETIMGIFNAVSQTFTEKEFDAKALQNCNYNKMKRFLYDVLTYCDIAANDLRPVSLGK